jgi:hypothetical protein
MDAQIKDGEWWAEWGMYCAKEFSIVSKMPSSRYLDVVGDNVLINQRSGRPSQKFMFDCTSRTIVNVATKKSITFSGNQVNVSSTTSEWNQLFRFKNEMITNVKGKVAQVDANKDREG